MKNTLLFFVFLAGCASSDKQADNTYRRADGRALVDDKYSLQADRKEMEELRSQIPAEKKRQNDELAYVLGLMTEVKRPPADIRSQFDSALRKKREIFDKDIQKERENFTKEERKKREDFLKSQQQQRDAFGHEKHSRDEKNEFYKNIDEKRTEAFSVEREKRNDFESDVRERRSSFEDYARQKQNEFNQEYRAYSKRYEDLKKESSHSQVKPSNTSEAAELEREFEKIHSNQGTTLESGE